MTHRDVNDAFEILLNKLDTALKETREEASRSIAAWRMGHNRTWEAYLRQHQG